MLKKNGLEKIQAEACLLKDGHVTEKIKERRRITKEVNKYEAIGLDDLKLPGPPALIDSGVWCLYLTVSVRENLLRLKMSCCVRILGELHAVELLDGQ